MATQDSLISKPLFLDCGNPQKILDAFYGRQIQGVTTNPSLLYKEGNFHSRREITQALLKLCEELRDPAYGGPIPISLEIDIDPDNPLSTARIVDEGLRLRSVFGDNTVVKIPVSPIHCFDAMKILSDQGVPVNATLIARWEQAVFAAQHGAMYVSPFLGRIDDLHIPNVTGMNLLAQIVEQYSDARYFGFVKILAASIRSVDQVVSAFDLGADIATVPWDVFRAICDYEWKYSKVVESDDPFSPVNLSHPVTEAGLLRFHTDNRKIR